MQDTFWLDRWERGATGFHQQEVHPALRTCWSSVGVAATDTVLVPMCGKSRDMLWLRAQGHRVLGVELSPVAVAAFFDENGMTASHTRSRSFDVSAADGFAILQGNFFDLASVDLEGVRAVYDRAALVALPPALQQRYVEQMGAMLPHGTRMLLVTLEYEGTAVEGPPFSVGEDDVRRLYGTTGSRVELLSRVDVLAANPSLVERGVTGLHECTFLITL
jgi:thiopurine S-methyltransferase